MVRIISSKTQLGYQTHLWIMSSHYTASKGRNNAGSNFIDSLSDRPMFVPMEWDLIDWTKDCPLQDKMPTGRRYRVGEFKLNQMRLKRLTEFFSII